MNINDYECQIRKKRIGHGIKGFPEKREASFSKAEKTARYEKHAIKKRKHRRDGDPYVHSMSNHCQKTAQDKHSYATSGGTPEHNLGQAMEHHRGHSSRTSFRLEG